MPVSSRPDGICIVPVCRLVSDLYGVYAATPLTPAVGLEINEIYQDQDSAAGDWLVHLGRRNSGIRTPHCQTTEPCSDPLHRRLTSALPTTS
eukprot:scaffold148002_cov38-Cyclotella_meneghiniana.AAC.6